MKFRLTGRLFVWTALLSMVLAVPLIVFAADLPICNREKPDDDPPYCLEPFSNCEDYFDPDICTAVEVCLGQYPYKVARKCESGGGKEKHCASCVQNQKCYDKHFCVWENGRCVVRKVCQYFWVSGKCNRECHEPQSS